MSDPIWNPEQLKRDRDLAKRIRAALGNLESAVGELRTACCDANKAGLTVIPAASIAQVLQAAGDIRAVDIHRAIKV